MLLDHLSGSPQRCCQTETDDFTVMTKQCLPPELMNNKYGNSDSLPQELHLLPRNLRKKVEAVRQQHKTHTVCIRRGTWPVQHIAGPVRVLPGSSEPYTMHCLAEAISSDVTSNAFLSVHHTAGGVATCTLHSKDSSLPSA
jgi:hypothetical protein